MQDTDHRFGMKLFFRLERLDLSPALPGSNDARGLSLPGAGMAFAGDLRFGKLAIPLCGARLASGRSCRRPSGGRMFEAAVLHLLRTDNSAGLAGPAKRRPRSPRRGLAGTPARLTAKTIFGFSQ